MRMGVEGSGRREGRVDSPRWPHLRKGHRDRRERKLREQPGELDRGSSEADVVTKAAHGAHTGRPRLLPIEPPGMHVEHGRATVAPVDAPHGAAPERPPDTPA